MLFVWIINAIRWVVHLVKIPHPNNLARIPRNAKCPVCGAAKGRLRCVRIEPPKGRSNQFASIRCQHRCAECGARWFEEPIVKSASAENILPSVPRDDGERNEDRSRISLIDKESASNS